MDYISKKTKIFELITPLLNGKTYKEQLEIIDNISLMNLLGYDSITLYNSDGVKYKNAFKSTITDLKYEILECIEIEKSEKNFNLNTRLL